MAWRVEVTDRVRRRLGKVDPPVARGIVEYLRQVEGLDDPRSKGKALSGPLAGLWRSRVGDWRIVVDIDDGRLVVVALDVDHRSRIYR